MNQINVIFPYQFPEDGMTWVFDDADKKLEKEALVGGMPEIIEFACEMLHIPRYREGFIARFSGDAFPVARPEAVFCLEKIPAPTIDLDTVPASHREFYAAMLTTGTYYKLELAGLGEKIGWLCPALLKYFSEPPDKLWVEVSAYTGEVTPRARALENMRQKQRESGYPREHDYAGYGASSDHDFDAE